MKRRTTNLTLILREASAAGLSYGQYVARENAKRGFRKPLPKDYLSINDRKRLGIETPIYCGTTTIEAGLVFDCPKTVDNIIETHIDTLLSPSDSKKLDEQILELYKLGWKVSEIKQKLCCKREKIIATLRAAEIGFSGRPPIAEDKIESMRELREDGYTYQAIAEEYGVAPMTVYRYLKEETE